MVMRPKSPEIIQAQIGAYLADLGEYGFNAIADINELPAEPLMKRLEDFIPDSNPNPLNPKNYLKFLTKNNGQQYHSIQYWREKLENYETFRSGIDQLRHDINGDDRRPVGSGEMSDVYRLEQGGQDYAIRIVQRGKLAPDEVIRYTAGLELGQGQPHLEQLVAVSPRDGITVSKFIPGKTLADFYPNDWEKIQVNHLSQLLGTISLASNLKIDVSSNLRNIIFNFDTETFTLIDYGRSYNPDLNRAVEAIGGLFTVLMVPGPDSSLKLLDSSQRSNIVDKLKHSIENTLCEEDIETLKYERRQFAL